MFRMDNLKFPRKKAACNKLIVDGAPTTDPPSYATTGEITSPTLANLSQSALDANVSRPQINTLTSKSFNSEDEILDTDFFPEEVDAANLSSPTAVVQMV